MRTNHTGEAYLLEWRQAFHEPPFVVLTLLFLVCHVVFYLGLEFAPRALDHVALEDGPLEYLSAALYFIAALFFIAVAWRSADDRLLRVWAVLFSLGFVVLCGEEISWGQRIFDYSVETVERVNVQAEFNLHNLVPGNLSGRLISVGSLLYGVAIPIALLLVQRLRSMAIDRLRFPAPHPVVASCFVLSYVWYKVFHPGSMVPLAIEETRETTIALAFAVAAVLFWLKVRRT